MTRNHYTVVVPAKAGTQCRSAGKTLGSRFRGNDESFAKTVTHVRNTQ